MSRRPFFVALAQSGTRWFFRVLLLLMYRVRVYGLKNYPAEDGFLICANHQSHLDPIVMGVICPRPINYLARQTLFRFKSLSWFLSWNDAIPIDLEGTGLAGLKETLRRLKRRETVLIFPEGTRSPDGKLQPIKLGFAAVGRRAKSDLLPIAFAGAFEAMPRTAWFPVPGSIQAVIGEPISYSEYQALTDEALGQLLDLRMQECFAAAKHRRDTLVSTL
jgi:1-acyl-sn-glycerol-3-phosphate acyltransferase